MTDKKSNMALWDRVCETNPAHTKLVQKSQGPRARKFTAIDAHYQVQRATEEWGPCGGRWGFLFKWMPHDLLWIATVTLWYPDGDAKCLVSQMGTAHRDGKYGIDDDALKKAVTDGLTKCLSYTGISADIFLGLYDDNKYVAEMREKFKPDADAGPATGGDLGAAKAELVTHVEKLRRETKSSMTTNQFIRAVITNHTGKAMLDTVGAVKTVRQAIEDGLYDLATGKLTPTRTPTPTPTPEPDTRNYMEEIAKLARVRYGADWFDLLNAECAENKINLGKMTDGEATRIIAMLSKQLEGAEK